MSAPADWEVFLIDHFPGYLLPQAYRRALPAEAAARFLERLGEAPRSLFLLRASSFLAARAEAIRAFVLEELPPLIASLPPRAQTDARIVTGSIEGRLDIPATLKQRLEGRAAHAVIRAPRLRRDRPETLLLKAVAARLLDVLRAFRSAGGVYLASAAAFQGLAACEEALSRALATTSLGALPEEPITPFHEQAAMEARRPGYTLAASLYRALHEALDADSPELIAKLVAEGALLPLEASTRFEIAVLIRLIQALRRFVDERAPGRFTLHNTVILPDRRDVAELVREGGGRVRLFYNQAVLSPGPHDRGVRHYLGQTGRLRPDITVVIEGHSGVSRAAVVEIKLSSEPDYLAQGYRQALVYRHEFAPDLTSWPKAILVCSADIPGAPRREDDVIAVGWSEWVPEIVLDGWLRDFF
jgi:hypothetical protein